MALIENWFFQTIWSNSDTWFDSKRQCLQNTLAKDSSSQFFESVSISNSKFIARSLLLFEKRQKRKSLKLVDDLYMRFSLKVLNSIYSHLRKWTSLWASGSYQEARKRKPFKGPTQLSSICATAKYIIISLGHETVSGQQTGLSPVYNLAWSRDS